MVPDTSMAWLFWKAIWAGTDTKRCFIQQSTSHTKVAQTCSRSKPEPFKSAKGCAVAGSFENEKCLTPPSPNSPIYCVASLLFFFYFLFLTRCQMRLWATCLSARQLGNWEERAIHYSGDCCVSIEARNRPAYNPTPTKNSFSTTNSGRVPTGSYLCVCWGKCTSMWHQS